MLTLYEYAIILQPKEDKDGEEIEPGKLLERGEVLATSAENAQIVAARKIPEEYLGDLDRISVGMRPF